MGRLIQHPRQKKMRFLYISLVEFIVAIIMIIWIQLDLHDGVEAYEWIFYALTIIVAIEALFSANYEKKLGLFYTTMFLGYLLLVIVSFWKHLLNWTLISVVITIPIYFYILFPMFYIESEAQFHYRTRVTTTVLYLWFYILFFIHVVLVTAVILLFFSSSREIGLLILIPGQKIYLFFFFFVIGYLGQWLIRDNPDIGDYILHWILWITLIASIASRLLIPSLQSIWDEVCQACFLLAVVACCGRVAKRRKQVHLLFEKLTEDNPLKPEKNDFMKFVTYLVIGMMMIGFFIYLGVALVLSLDIFPTTIVDSFLIRNDFIPADPMAFAYFFSGMLANILGELIIRIKKYRSISYEDKVLTNFRKTPTEIGETPEFLPASEESTKDNPPPGETTET